MPESILSASRTLRFNSSGSTGISASITPNRHSAVDIGDWILNERYHNELVLKQDKILRGILQNCEDNGLPRLHLSEAQGKFLHLFARSMNAARILEVGTLGGYSTVWLARAVPTNGKVVTMEISERFARVAKENFEQARVDAVVDVIIGPAQDNIKMISSEPPFDLAFIDADKESNIIYFKEAKRLVKPGGVIIVDNVVWHGRPPLEKYNDDPDVEGIRKLLKYISTDTEVDATTIATVGSKGYDGFLFARCR